MTKNDLTIKERIIKTLLESNKTTGEIAIALYSDEKGVKYNNVGDDLDSLEEKGFIRWFILKTNKPGAPATTYEIVYNKSILIKLLETYPSLLLDLQKSDRVISLLSNEFNDEDTYGNLKGWLAISLGFFKLFLNNNHDAIIDQGNMIYLYTKGIKLLETDNTLTTTILPVDLVLLSTMQHCILNDIVENQATPEGIDFLRIFKKIDFELDRRLSDELLNSNGKTDFNNVMHTASKFGSASFFIANRRRLFKGDIPFNYAEFFLEKPQC